MEGNEEADRLAKAGSETSNFEPEPHLSIPQSVCAGAIERWVKRKHAERWEAYVGGIHTKCFFQKPDEKWAEIASRGWWVRSLDIAG